MYSQASIANEKDGPSQLKIPGSTCCAKSSTYAKTDTAPQDLGNKRGLLGQGHIDDTETCGPSLGKDDILRLEELSNARPQVGLSNGVVRFIGNKVREWRDVDLLRNLPELGQLGRQVGEEPLEADSRVERVQNSGMVGMKLI